MPNYCGTLAAARALGDADVPVWIASESAFGVAGRSNRVSRRFRCPDAGEPDALLAWLASPPFSERPTLYPTCDDLAWLQARNADVLAPRYRLYAPAARALEALLDKRSLAHACADVGIATPQTFDPLEESIGSIAARATFPLLLKQRTQVYSSTHTKGTVVTSREELAPAYEAFVASNTHAPVVLDAMPNASVPIVQAYHSEGQHGSYLLSGFIDESGELFAMRAASKVLQRPRRLGIALCLEEAEVDEALARNVAALCKRVGYFGVFQVEFLTTSSGRLLIDMNPRYYHYMAFDIARGLRLPELAHLAALGERSALESAVMRAKETPANAPRAFTYRLHLRELLLAQSVTGVMSREEARSWRAWYDAHAATLVDAVIDQRDRFPALVDALTHLLHRARHPRSFLRHIALDR